MEVFFNKEEQEYLSNILKIDIINIFNKLKKIEDIYDISEFNNNISSIIKESNIDQYHKIIVSSATKFIKEHNYTEIHLNSMKYYYRCQEKDFDELSNSRSNNVQKSFQLYQNHLLSYQSSLLNMFSELVVPFNNPKNKKVVAIFESCQANMHPLNMLYEAKNIKDSLLSSKSYYPFVTLSTNKRMFKLVVEKHLPEIMHFICHGEINGDLVFFNGNYSGTKNLSPEYLEGFKSIYGCKKVELIYLNSCFSSKFVQKSSINGCKNYIDHHLGYTGENNDLQARDFSEKFYSDLATFDNPINITYNDVYNAYPDVNVSIEGKLINYKENLILI